MHMLYIQPINLHRTYNSQHIYIFSQNQSTKHALMKDYRKSILTIAIATTILHPP